MIYMNCHHLYRLFTAIICAERSDTETRFSPHTLVFPCQKHSSTAPYSFILHPVPLFTFSILCFSSTPVHCGPRRPIQSPFLPVSGHFVPNDYFSQCPQIPFSFISLIISWSSFFPCSAHSGGRYFLAFFRYSSCQYFHTILIQAIQ